MSSFVNPLYPADEIIKTDSKISLNAFDSADIEIKAQNHEQFCGPGEGLASESVALCVV